MVQLRLFLFVLSLGLIHSCTTTAEKKTDDKKIGPQAKPSPFIGTFVSEGYLQRANGSDWVSVSITQIKGRLFHIEVRSRADIKKPTCTLTTDAQLTEEGELYASQYDLDLGFRIWEDKLRIYSPSNKDLNYFCSGGATLAGKYKRISGKLPEKQIDHSQFWKFLEYTDFTFTVQAANDTLTIQPVLPKRNVQEVKIPFNGSIADSDIADLDADGFPEVYVYVREGEDQHIRLVAYNFNKGKSLSQIYLQEVPRKETKGFHGGDEFKPVEGALIRRYPIEGTEKMQQIQYKLKMGEAAPQLVVDKILSF